MDCGDFIPSFNLSMFRSNGLNPTEIYKKSPWVDQIAIMNVSLLILNTGGSFSTYVLIKW
jgi:hypothetical protein